MLKYHGRFKTGIKLIDLLRVENKEIIIIIMIIKWLDIVDSIIEFILLKFRIIFLNFLIIYLVLGNIY